MRLCAVVITYYPDVEETLRNCMAYIDLVDTLIVWENTPEKDRLRYRLDFDAGYADKVTIMGDGDNHCIGYPLNRVVAWAQERGYTHLLTMDQDSLFEPGAFVRYKEIIEGYEDDVSIGIFGANPNRTHPESNLPKEVNETITSGSVYDLAKLEQIGYFREDFAIDGVDFEISSKAKAKGFKTVIIGVAHLTHCLGSALPTRWGFYADNYSPFRVYYITRNHLVLSREYPDRYTVTAYLRFYIPFKIPCKIVIINRHYFVRVLVYYKKACYAFLYTLNSEESNKQESESTQTHQSAQ